MNRTKYEPSAEYREKEREAKALRKDVSTACAVIADGILRYKKKMLRARSKKQVDDPVLFAPLDDYSSKREIQDAYGWEYISESEMDKLNALWDAREQYINAQGRFTDRVTEMLERAMNNCGGEYEDALDEFADMERRSNADLARIERENRENSYKRYIAGL
jgi:hypothetical protein